VEIKESSVSTSAVILQRTVNSKGEKVTIVDFDPLGQVEFPGWENPSPEAIEGAKIGLRYQRGDLTYPEAVRKANEIDTRLQREIRNKQRRLPRGSQNPALDTLARVIGGIPPRKAKSKFDN